MSNHVDNASPPGTEALREELRRAEDRLRIRTEQLHAACRQRDEAIATLNNTRLQLTREEARLLVDAAVTGETTDGPRFKAILQRLDAASK